MLGSTFNNDLSKEMVLGTYLDKFYSKIFQDSSYSIERIDNLKMQHQGVDLILDNGKERFFVDEKAQLDFLNGKLPTFAFELSYLKDNYWRQGWLHDESKITNVYFLITEIMVEDKRDISKGVESFKVTGIYRDRLINFLNKKGLTSGRLSELENQVRTEGKGGKIRIQELDFFKEGNINFSIQKNEKPINLVLKLDFLIDNGVGSII
jgi:hypothetical protein